MIPTNGLAAGGIVGDVLTLLNFCHFKFYDQFKQLIYSSTFISSFQPIFVKLNIKNKMMISSFEGF